MQIPLPPSLSVGQIALWLIATIFASGLIAVIATRFLYRRKYKAEVVQVSAGTIKIEAEARQIDAATVVQLVEKVRELVEINSELQDELNETGRQRDNFEVHLRIRDQELEKEKIAGALREHFIQQLEAANKMGIALKDLSPHQSDSPEKKVG